MTRKNVGYIRLSQEDGKSFSVENQMEDLRKFDPKMPIYVDDGVTGKFNLTDPKSEWSLKVKPLLEADPENIQLVVVTDDRIGRKKGKVLSAIEDITDAGGSVHLVREGKTYTDSEDTSQGIDLTFRALASESYRVTGTKRTQVALDAMKDAGIPLGKKPQLTEKDIEEIKRLRKLGLGYTAIGKAVRTFRKKDEVWTVTTPRTIKRVLNGEYESREALERRSLAARKAMAARSYLSRYDAESGGDQDA